MQFHIAQNGEKSGPFDRDEVYRRLVAGELKPTDLGWSEGMAEWEPLSKLIPPQTPPLPTANQAVFGPSAASTVPARQQTSGLAIGSLVCGIASFFCLGLPGLPAIIMGHMALSRIKKSGGELGGQGLAIGGLVTGYIGFFIVGIAIFASLAVPAFSSIQKQALQMKSVVNAKQLVVGMRQYAAEHEGNFPPSLETLYEEKLIDDRRLLEEPSTQGKTTGEQAWEYRGAGLKDSAEANTIVLISRKADRRGERIVARLDGSAEVVRGDRLQSP